MAHHGGQASPSSPQQLAFSDHHHIIVPPPRPPAPRVHRPRMPIMTPPPPTTIILQPLNGGGGTTTTTAATTTPTEVSLSTPRPDGERTVNEYVETPFRPAATAAIEHHHGSKNSEELIRGGEGRLSLLGSRREPPHHQALHLPINTNKKDVHHHHPRLHRGVVTKQPGAAATFKKDVAPGGGSSAVGGGPSGGVGVRRGTTVGSSVVGVGGGVGGGGGECFQSGSIICPACGRCRCESCRQPRPLPSKWLCNNACFCSAETSLDYVSCLCCVKGFFYHCSKDYEQDGTASSCADDPCSCGPHRFFARWGCLAAVSLVMPCLWCYWPLKACVGLCEKCYARYSSQGCRCEQPRRDPKLSDLTPEKRLLDTSPEF